MDNKDLYNLLAKTDVSDLVPPDFKLSRHKRKRYARKSMKKIMAYENSNFRIAEKTIKLKRRAVLIFIAAVILSAMTVSASIMTVMYFWNPSRGMVDNYGNKIDADNEYTVLMSETAKNFGNAVLSYVICTEYENNSTLSVWIIDETDRSISEKLIKDLYAVAPDGKYALRPNGYDSANGYNYVCDYFPKQDKVKVASESLGISVEMTLVERERKEIFVPEIAGYSFELSISEDGSEFNLVIIDRNILASEMSEYVYFRMVHGMNWTLWDADGNSYNSGGGGGGVDEYGRSFSTLAIDGVKADKIVKIDIPWLTFRYNFDFHNNFGYDIPLPADGETLYGDWHAFNMDGLRDRVDSITRDGDKLIIHQPSIALEYSSNVPIFDSESNPEILLYDENGDTIQKTIKWDFDYERNEEGNITSECGRTMTAHFEEGALDEAARIELSEHFLWIYIEGDWSVEIK